MANDSWFYVKAKFVVAVKKNCELKCQSVTANRSLFYKIVPKVLMRHKQDPGEKK